MGDSSLSNEQAMAELLTSFADEVVPGCTRSDSDDHLWFLYLVNANKEWLAGKRYGGPEDTMVGNKTKKMRPGSLPDGNDGVQQLNIPMLRDMFARELDKEGTSYDCAEDKMVALCSLQIAMRTGKFARSATWNPELKMLCSPSFA
jgi:hypothetical protein